MRLLALIVSVALFTSASVRSEEGFGTKAEAVAMVQRAQDMFRKEGSEATFAAISDKSNKTFHDRDLYAFVYNLAGLNVAHGARPALIGKDLIDLKDQDGRFLIREMAAIAKGPGSGWFDYKWPNPITNRIEDKTSYVEKMGADYFVGVGVYRQ